MRPPAIALEPTSHSKSGRSRKQSRESTASTARSSSSSSAASMTAAVSSRSSHAGSRGNFHGGLAPSLSSSAAPPPPPIERSALLAATADDRQRRAGVYDGERTRDRKAPPSAQNAKKTQASKRASNASTMSRHSSFSDSSSSQQLCIGDLSSTSSGAGGAGQYYQLPLSGGFDDDTSNDELSASAYFYNSSQQQQHGTSTHSNSSSSKSKSKRRRSSKARWTDSNHSFLTRDRFIRKYLADSLLVTSSSSANNHNSSFLSSSTSSLRRRVSFSSSSSSSLSFLLNHSQQQQLPASSCYVPVAKDPARAAALEHDVLLSSSCSHSSRLKDAALVGMARAAKRQLESVAKRHVMVGKWKQRFIGTSSINSRTSQRGSYHHHSSARDNSAASDCQVYECLTSSKDQYSVVAKINLPCSLREIQSVLAQSSASRGTEFHRSMAMLFGDQYVYGLSVRAVDCAAHPPRRSSSASTRASSSSTANQQHAPTHQQQAPSSRLAVNAVSLLMKRRLVWRPQNMSFLDFCDEKPHTQSVTRVLQTLDALEDDEDEDDQEEYDGEDSHESSQRHQRQRGRQSSALQLHESKSRARGLRGLLAGYVLQEDPEEQFTRLFFYATHKSPSQQSNASGKLETHASKKPAKVTGWSVQLIREMVTQLCSLESVVLRRRLGFYPILDMPPPPSPAQVSPYRHSSSSTGSDVALLQTSVTPSTACCASCAVPFNALLLRKRHFCHLCGLYTCRKCSRVEQIEKVLGLIDRRRVCASCVSRVSYCVFNIDDQPAFADSYQLQLQHKSKAMMQMMFGCDTSSSSSNGKKLADVPEEEFPMLLGDDDDDLALTMLEDLAHEQLENDLAAEKVATYLKKMLERSSGAKSPFTSQQQSKTCERGAGNDEGGDEEATDATPKESICLLDSANALRSSLDSE